MHLKRLTYAEFEGGPQEWRISGLDLGPINLIVGRNASGKSRVLSVINSLSLHLIGKRAPGLSGCFDFEFQWNEKLYRYQLQIENMNVIKEEVTIDGEVFLKRGGDGTGDILFEQFGGQSHRFQSASSTVAAYTRRDGIQHSFLEPLALWAERLRYYPFAGQLGQTHLAVFAPQGAVADDRDPNQTVGLFRSGMHEFGPEFANRVIADLAAIDYRVRDIRLGSPITVRLDSGAPELNCIQITEEGVEGIVDQLSMSTGMYRVVAMLINVNLAIFRKAVRTILLDDVGEGLDYERSCRFIKLIRDSCDEEGIQLIMATNDKFVMNSIPLHEWTILHRKGAEVMPINSINSKDMFDEFKYTGLSNFNFFEFHGKDVGSQAD